MPILQYLQQTIQSLHDIEVDLDVAAYVVNDEVRREIPGAREGLQEQLFVREDADGMELALYIAPAIVACLEKDDPLTRLHAGNLESFCIALEGVSHFVFLAWRAKFNLPVSALELEIQAEVDKFVACWLLLETQGQERRSTAAPLSRQIFESYVLHEDVAPEERERYHTASRVAGHYCRTLTERYSADDADTRIKRDVRAYYRQGLAQKLRAA